ncbi:MAG: GGDEF domain-containing protein [Pseudomonadota bacterium]|nr:GGDEF domain-containing protein [Pseudomonadota bacterium]
MTKPSLIEEFGMLPERSELLRGIELIVRLALKGSEADVCWFQPVNSGLPQVRQVVRAAALLPEDNQDCRELAVAFLQSGRDHLISPNVKADPLLKELHATRREGDVRTFAAWRVSADGQQIGAMCLAQFRAGLPAPDQLRSAREAAELLSIWFGAVHTALVDEMTGLLERAYAESVLQKELRRAMRTLRSVSVVMIDVDHFKRLNDALGHPAGDRALVAIADLMTSHFERAGEVISRWGGEEFLVAQFESGREVSLEQVRHLLTRVEAAEIPNPDAAGGVVTLSAGMATLKPQPTEGRSVEPKTVMAALIRRADQALYQAKSAGRNRVIDAGDFSVEQLESDACEAG